MVCKHLQLEHEMSMQNNMSYSMMNGQSPQTPQEDYQDPKNRYVCTSVPQQWLLLYARQQSVQCGSPCCMRPQHLVDGLKWRAQELRGISLSDVPGASAANAHVAAYPGGMQGTVLSLHDTCCLA